MNLVEVKRISYYPPSKGYAVLLQEENEGRSIPIIVGSAEAQAIALYLEDVNMPRPMTHDLLINVLESILDNISNGPIVQLKPSLSASSISIYFDETSGIK